MPEWKLQTCIATVSPSGGLAEKLDTDLSAERLGVLRDNYILHDKGATREYRPTRRASRTASLRDLRAARLLGLWRSQCADPSRRAGSWRENWKISRSSPRKQGRQR